MVELNPNMLVRDAIIMGHYLKKPRRYHGECQWLPLHLSSGPCTFVGTFYKIVPIRPDVGLLFEMSRHGQVVVVRTIYSSSYC